MAVRSHSRNPAHDHHGQTVVVDESTPELDSQVKEFASLNSAEDRYFLDEAAGVSASSGPKLTSWLTALALLIAGLVLFLSTLMNAKVFSLANRLSVIPTPTVIPTSPVMPSPTATPTPTQIPKSAAKITILNGSGTPGLAGQAKQLLQSAGYANITTGNADSYSYTQTTITNVPSASLLAQDIITVLKPKFVATLSSSLPASTADVEIIIGSQ